MIDAMKSRYTVKKYAGEKLRQEDLDELKEVLRLCPSSINAQPWRFVFVRDEEAKAKFAHESKFNEAKILDADTLVIFQIQTEEFFKENAPSYLPERIFNYYEQEVTKRPGGYLGWASRQAYIAMGVLLSFCAEKGIGSTPMEGINPKEYDKILDDSNYQTLAAVSLGVPAEDDFNKPENTPKERLPLDQVIKEI